MGAILRTPPAFHLPLKGNRRETIFLSGLWLVSSPFSRLLFCYLTMNLCHVEVACLVDQILEGGLGQGASLGEDDDLFADNHQGRNRSNVERAGEILLLFGIDLAEEDLRVLFRDLFVDRTETLAGAAPWKVALAERRPMAKSTALLFFCATFLFRNTNRKSRVTDNADLPVVRQSGVINRTAMQRFHGVGREL